MSTDQTTERAGHLLQILDLEKVEENLFIGQNELDHPRRLFGGQVLAQAARAAYATVEGLRMHSLHAYFLRAGAKDRPVLYEIERIRDGRSFTTRRVVAIQNGEAIFNMDVSFQVDEPGFEHAHPMPNVPPPDELDDDVVIARAMGDDERLSAMAREERPFESRSVFAPGTEAWADNRHWNPVWLRFREQVAKDDDVMARCLLAYASDMGLVSTAVLPHQVEHPRGDFQTASLDHALWIHRDVPIDQWLLFHKRTSTAQGARGMVHADFFDEAGDLVASVTQEGLVRLKA